jgi:hypothetical protein
MSKRFPEKNFLPIQRKRRNRTGFSDSECWRNHLSGELAYWRFRFSILTTGVKMITDKSDFPAFPDRFA